MTTPKSKPVAVLISDLHFTVPTLELATKSSVSAISEAEKLGVPLVMGGDTLDGKAIIRGECANRLVEILRDFSNSVGVYMLVGNHDLLSEKSKEHSLNFLRNFVQIVDAPFNSTKLGHIIPYMNDVSALQEALNKVPKGSRILMHQGVQTAYMGHYIQDKTSLPKEAYGDYRVISGHYHRAQDIRTGRPRKGAVGMFSYIGNPYTLSFAEANDGPKGFQVLYDNGLMEQVPLDLRKHVIIERHLDDLYAPFCNVSQDDLVWLKVSSSSQSDLVKLKKKDIADKLFGHMNFKLDKICTEVKQKQEKGETEEATFDSIIDATSEVDIYKTYLKQLWKDVVK